MPHGKIISDINGCGCTDGGTTLTTILKIEGLVDLIGYRQRAS